ncbi:cytoplasmic dynein 2 light intermediate chain 1 [Nymphalis io]|uniref:cytoplasmic dynein 2 light intermediate chain 1 n=1 Tax=Inachis io TaxID=171585 RepID=UPI00216825A9|nr:cytoplasmic dynein 2 light intermediate chain 1 [Nymphalis io]
MSIPDIAAQMVKNNTSKSSEDNARTIILVGSKSVGKTILLHSFLDKTETPKETLVLEYSFGRKSSQKQSIDKTICHVWEYGGKLEMLKNVLTSIPIDGKFFYFVMVDLSKIKAIWNTLETCIIAVKEKCNDSPDNLELIIIGGKYDIFKNYDSEIKKIICTTMRSVALIHNANLLFYSLKESNLVRKAKDMFYTIGFGNNVPLKEKNTNYMKPLIIPKGSDSWESIGVPESTLDHVKARHLSRITSETEIKQEVKSIQRSHPEPILDSLVALKYEELRNMESFDPSIDDYLILLR